MVTVRARDRLELDFLEWVLHCTERFIGLPNLATGSVHLNRRLWTHSVIRFVSRGLCSCTIYNMLACFVYFVFQNEDF